MCFFLLVTGWFGATNCYRFGFSCQHYVDTKHGGCCLFWKVKGNMNHLNVWLVYLIYFYIYNNVNIYNHFNSLSAAWVKISVLSFPRMFC